MADGTAPQLDAKRAADVLEQHNRWRRGDVEETPDAVDPRLVGEAIDLAIRTLRGGASA